MLQVCFALLVLFFTFPLLLVSKSYPLTASFPIFTISYTCFLCFLLYKSTNLPGNFARLLRYVAIFVDLTQSRALIFIIFYSLMIYIKYFCMVSFLFLSNSIKFGLIRQLMVRHRLSVASIPLSLPPSSLSCFYTIRLLFQLAKTRRQSDNLTYIIVCTTVSCCSRVVNTGILR